MKKYILLICFVGKFMVAQKTIVTYYDEKSGKKKEEYIVDDKGIKNGSYKNYNEAGELMEDGVFKLGKKNGVFTEYTKFPNFILKPQLKSKVTYVNDIKEGPAEYYDFDKDIAVHITKKGNYKQDKQDGVWTQVIPFSKIYTEIDYANLKTIPVFKNSMGVTLISSFKMGEDVIPTGKSFVNYYPSNKLYHSFKLINGKLAGEDIYLYPDGKLWDKKVYTDSGEYFSTEAYYYNGKIKQKEITKPYFYEGYDPDGAPNKVMSVKINENFARITNAEILNKAVSVANKLAKEGNSLQAMSNLEKKIKDYIDWKNLTFNYSNTDPEELKEARLALEKIRTAK